MEVLLTVCISSFFISTHVRIMQPSDYGMLSKIKWLSQSYLLCVLNKTCLLWNHLKISHLPIITLKSPIKISNLFRFPDSYICNSSDLHMFINSSVAQLPVGKQKQKWLSLEKWTNRQTVNLFLRPAWKQCSGNSFEVKRTNRVWNIGWWFLWK